MNPGRSYCLRAALLALLVSPASLVAQSAHAAAAPAPAAAPAAAISPLEHGQALYDAAKFTEAVTLLRTELSAGRITGSDVVAARALLARALVKSGNRLEARQAFETALRLDPAYRPNAVVVPPDEMDVFNLALQAVTAEQIEAGRRVPASLAFFYGTGSGDNKSLGQIQTHYGGKSTLDAKPEFGVSVRFPLRPRFSLDLEISRLRATGTSDSSAVSQYVLHTKYEASAIPLIASLYWNALPGTKFRANLFTGVGRLAAASNSIDMNYDNTFRFLFADTKTGSYFHIGAEGEYMIVPKLSLTGRALYRSATATKLFKESALLTLVDPSAPELKGRKVDFSGTEFAIGLRAYIGY